MLLFSQKLGNYPELRQEQEMTRKDYELIAGAINGCATVTNKSGRLGTIETVLISKEHLVNMLATDLEIDNPRFDRARFLTACGVK